MNLSLNTSLLGQIIKITDAKSTETIQPGQQLVILDSKGNVYSTKPTGPPSYFKTYSYYIIDFSKTISFDGYLTTLSQNGDIANILTEYSLKCQPINATTLASKVQTMADGSEILNNLLIATISEAEKTISLADDFYGKRNSIEKLIISKLREYGLTVLSFKLKLENEQERLKQQSINLSLFKVTLEGDFPKVNMGITATIGLLTGQESKFLLNPLTDQVLEDEILKIVRAFIGKGISPDELYEAYNKAIKDELCTKINTHLAAYGRQLTEFSITLHKSGSLNPVIIESKDFIDVRVSDSMQSLKLKYICELVPASQHKGRSLLFPVDTEDILEKVQNEIKNTISAKINIEEFSDHLNTSVAEKLATAITNVVAELGREVGFFQLVSKGIPPSYIEIKHSITCTSKDGYPITVDNILLLQRDYAANKTLEATRINDFENWGKAELNRIAKNFIIIKSYNELLFDFDDSLMRDEMQKEAQKIGYTVNQLIALPQFEKTDKPEWFKISYRDTNLNSRIDGIALALSVHIEGRLSNYKKIMKMLLPKESVIESIQKKIDSKIRQFFNSLDPDRFYVRFYKKDVEKGDTKTLEEEIKEIVIAYLEEEYDAEIRDVAVNPLNTPLIIRFKQLQEGIFECDFRDKTCFFNYTVKVSILSVDPERWSVFNAKAYKPRNEDANDTERKDIASHIKGYVENGMNTQLVPMVRKGELDNNNDFVAGIIRLLEEATVEIKEIFGLAIQIYTPIKVDPEATLNEKMLEEKTRKTKAELEMQEMIHTITIKEKKERLELLYKQRKEKEENNYLSNSPELKRINDEIEKLEAGPSWDNNGPISLENPFA